jgi:hypothetical protein
MALSELFVYLLLYLVLLYACEKPEPEYRLELLFLMLSLTGLPEKLFLLP